MKLSLKQLRSLVIQEAAKFGKETPIEDVEAEETEASELADSLENHVDHTVKEGLREKVKLAQALKLEEARLAKRIKQLHESRLQLSREILGIK